jgi:hypothetical protein
VLRCQTSKKSLRAESLRVRRAQKARPDVYAETPELLGSDLPHEMSYSTDKTLQYGVTPAQESGVAVHMFHQLTIAIRFSSAPESYDLYSGLRASSGAIDSARRGHKMLKRAALERAARFVSAAVKDATAPMRASSPAVTPSDRATRSRSIVE